MHSRHVVLMDMGDEIRAEYAKAFSDARPYQLGVQFLIHILRHQGDLSRVKMVELMKDGSGEFVDFPKAKELSTFDRSDRKFAALAKKTSVSVTNATDSDWAIHFAALSANNIGVKFLCGAAVKSWFVLKS